jgi:hypothetical protein
MAVRPMPFWNSFPTSCTPSLSSLNSGGQLTEGQQGEGKHYNSRHHLLEQMFRFNLKTLIP